MLFLLWELLSFIQLKTMWEERPLEGLPKESHLDPEAAPNRNHLASEENQHCRDKFGDKAFLPGQSLAVIFFSLWNASLL